MEGKKLPVFELLIDDNNPESGVNMVSLVDSPAIQVGWMHFDEHKSVQFAIENEEKRIIYGALLIPDQKIYRFDEQTNEEFYVTMSKEAIYKVRERFMRNRYTNNTNAQHNEKVLFDDVYMVETFLSDKSKGINPPTQFADLPDGTWFAAFKVDNETVWTDFVKTGVFTGFSIEGQFKMKRIELNSNLIKNKMSTFKEQFSELFAKFFPDTNEEAATEETQLMEATLIDGTAIKYDPALEVGASVTVVTEDGDLPAPDGEHELSDGTKFSTEGGLITEVKPLEATQPEEEIPVAQQLEPLLAEIVEKFSAQVNALKLQIEKVAAENATTKTQFAAITSENKDLKVSLSAFIEEVKAMPTAEPLRAPSQSTVKLSQKERALKMAEALTKIKS